MDFNFLKPRWILGTLYKPGFLASLQETNGFLMLNIKLDIRCLKPTWF